MLCLCPPYNHHYLYFGVEPRHGQLSPLHVRPMIGGATHFLMRSFIILYVPLFAHLTVQQFVLYNPVTNPFHGVHLFSKTWYEGTQVNHRESYLCTHGEPEKVWLEARAEVRDDGEINRKCTTVMDETVRSESGNSATTGKENHFGSLLNRGCHFNVQ